MSGPSQNKRLTELPLGLRAMTEEDKSREIYNSLHKADQLRFPLEDYAVFYSWLNVPRKGQGLRLLDIACGQGFFLEAAEQSGTELELHGIDFSPVALLSIFLNALYSS